MFSARTSLVLPGGIAIILVPERLVRAINHEKTRHEVGVINHAKTRHEVGVDASNFMEIPELPKAARKAGASSGARTSNRDT